MGQADEEGALSGRRSSLNLESGPRYVGRYELLGEIGSGGMAVVHIGRLRGAGGFSRKVAVKRIHAHLAKEKDFLAMFTDEARMAAQVHHPNVVPTLDVIVDEDGHVSQVMEYVDGDSLHRLLRRVAKAGQRLPQDVVGALIVGILDGLHAAHEATTDAGEHLGLVHRDVAPANVLVSRDGVPMLHDFGVAKARGRLTTTRDGHIKGHLTYMAPEQVVAPASVDRRADIYAAGLILWEMVVGRRLRKGSNEGTLFNQILNEPVPPPSAAVVDGVTLVEGVDDIVAKACAERPEQRYSTAAEMSEDAARVLGQAVPRIVAQVLRSHLGPELDRRAAILQQLDTAPARDAVGDLSDLGPPTPSHTTPLSGLARRPNDEPSAPAVSLPPKDAWRGKVALLGAGALLSAVVLLLGRGCLDDEPGTRAPATKAATSATTPPVPQPTQVPATASAVTPTPSSVPPSAAPSVTQPTPVSKPAPVPVPLPPPPPVAAPPPPPTVDCNPPYYLTAEGTRRYKSECL